MQVSRYIYRMWYYFRIGYSTYLTFLLGFATTMVTVYYLAIKNMPVLLHVFPNFLPFAIAAIIVGVPSSCIIGWVHMKGSAIWRSEMDISVEANPYFYKMYPGYWKEAFTPLYLELLRAMKILLEKERILTSDDRRRIESIEEKLQKLIEGGYVGSPRTRIKP